MPTKEGYIFKGWYTEESGGIEITRDTNVTITSNLTLYAHWEALGLHIHSTVIKHENSHTVEIDLYDITVPCNIIVVGYKNKATTALETRPYSQDRETFTLQGDIDTIKVMLWDDKMHPLCAPEVITQNHWTVQ